MKLNKIVFPVAGLGSRFLPATKATPKEMLPIVDKPLIQYAVEEAIDAGFTELIFVNAKSKISIKEHFDPNLNLEISNLTKEKKELLNQTNQIIPNNVSCSYIIQDEPLGLGHAILLAKSVIKKDPFAVILADDLIDSQKGVLKQMVEEYKDSSSSIVSVQKIDKSNSIHYGMVSIRDENLKSMQLENIIEKPLPKDSPSNLGVVGRYILNSSIFDRIVIGLSIFGFNRSPSICTDLFTFRWFVLKRSLTILISTKSRTR